MDKSIQVPDSLKEKIVEIGASVTETELDTYTRIREVEDKSHKLRTILKAWERQQSQERKMRSVYAKWLLIALFAQMIVVNIAFFGIGLQWLVIEKWVSTTFIMTVFGEIAAMALIVVKYLFPKVGAEVLSLIEKL
jgi:hypothetical protein